MQKEQPNSSGTNLCAQIAKILQEKCNTCFLKNTFSTLMGIPDILEQHYLPNALFIRGLSQEHYRSVREMLHQHHLPPPDCPLFHTGLGR